MSIAVQKTLSLVLLMVIGLLLKKKIGSREELGGIKMLILSVALPATIFLALLKIEIRPGLLALPLLALCLNGALLLAMRYILPWLGLNPKTAAFRTYWLLLPSLAPGLTCFPFVAEYLGEKSLAQAALADVGNKVFVLILLYLLAMHLFTHGQRALRQAPASDTRTRLRGLFLSLLHEPVNLVMAAALILLVAGLDVEFLPAFLQDAIGKLSSLMTPLVLLFIGLAVRFNRRQFREIFSLLLLRSGLVFCLSALLIACLPVGNMEMALLAVAFPQSAVSFWPFAHMSAVAAREQEERTFDLELALNILALSMPFSTLIILLVFSSGGLLASAGVGAFIIGFAFKDIGENFLAGIMLAFNRPFKVGDIVELENMKGKVIALSLRNVHMKTFDGRDVFIPNAKIVKEPVVNYTIDGYLRYDFTIGFDYESDIPRAEDIIRAALGKIPGILQQERAPAVAITKLAPSTMDLTIYYWRDAFDQDVSAVHVKNQAIIAVLAALEEAGYYLPSDILEIRNYRNMEILHKTS